MTNYEYDVRDQLRRVTNGASELGRYDYDAERRRLTRSTAGGALLYVYDGAEVVEESGWDAATQRTVPLNRYEHGLEIVKAQLAGEGERYYFSEGQGSVTMLATAGNALAQRTEYEAWGEVLSQTNSSVNAIGYTGARRDNESGLLALGNGERFYNPALGRFIQQDRWSGMAGLAQSLNRYAYGVNNPVRWTDRTGNMPDGLSASAATQIGGGESSSGAYQADSQLADDSYARGMAQQNTGRSYEENASEVPFTQIMREQTQARAMQAQRDVIAGFQTLGTGNKYVGNWTKFMYAAGKGAANRVINLPGNIREGILGVMNLSYDVLTDYQGTVNRAKEKVTDIAVKAIEISQDKWGTYEKVMDSLTAMGEDGLISAAGEMTGGAAFDYWSGGLTKGMGGKALAMAQETKVGRAVTKVFTEIGGKVDAIRQSIKTVESKAIVNIGKKFGLEPWMGSLPLKFGDDLITTYNYNNLKKSPRDGWADVLIHGDHKGNRFLVNGRKITAQELAERMIVEGYEQGTPIRLISCHSGRCDTGGAAQLSEILRTKVEAPTVPVQALDDGTLFLNQNYLLKNKKIKAKWETFENGKKVSDQ